MDKMQLYLIIVLFMVYIAIVIFVIYLFLAHRKIIIRIFELDVLLCPRHSPIGMSLCLLMRMVPSKGLCKDCEEEETFISQKENFFATQTNIITHLQIISTLLDSCTSKSLKYFKQKIVKYIWLCENTKQNWDRLFSNPDSSSLQIYRKLNQSYDYLISDCCELSHSIDAHFALEDIDQLNIILEHSNHLQNILQYRDIKQLNPNFTYLLALFKDINENISNLSRHISSVL